MRFRELDGLGECPKPDESCQPVMYLVRDNGRDRGKFVWRLRRQPAEAQTGRFVSRPLCADDVPRVKKAIDVRICQRREYRWSEKYRQMTSQLCGAPFLCTSDDELKDDDGNVHGDSRRLHVDELSTLMQYWKPAPIPERDDDKDKPKPDPKKAGGGMSPLTQFLVFGGLAIGAAVAIGRRT